MEHLKSIFAVFIFFLLFLSMQAQVFEKVEEKLSIEFLVSGGSLTLLDPDYKEKTYISHIGSFESSRGYFFETGIDLKRKFKKNSIKTGLYYGFGNVTLRGEIPTYETFITIFIDPFPSFFEDIPTESFEAKVLVNRLSIPLSFIKESKRMGKFNIDHEFGLLFDLKLFSNFGEVEHDIIQVPEFFWRQQSESDSNFSLPRNVGIRFLYGLSAELSHKLSLTTNLRFGIFDTHPNEDNADLFYSATLANNYKDIDRSTFGYFEMGFGLKYKLK